MHSFCACLEEGMDKVLLGRCCFTASTADIDPLHGDHLDLQSASSSVSTFKHDTNYPSAGNGHGFNRGFLLCTPSYAPHLRLHYIQPHSIHQVMIMKMHSYITVNGQLQHATHQSRCLLNDLREATGSAGGWDQAILDAKTRRAEVDTSAEINSSSHGTPPDSTPSQTPHIREGSSTSYTDAATAVALRQRLAAVSSATNGNLSVVAATTPESQMQNWESQSEASNDDHTPFAPHPLVDHPDERIAEMAKDYSELQSELTSPGPCYVHWPNNITLKNFAVYQLLPTLVYELEYPRTDRYAVLIYYYAHLSHSRNSIRPIYVFEKTVRPPHPRYPPANRSLCRWLRLAHLRFFTL